MSTLPGAALFSRAPRRSFLELAKSEKIAAAPEPLWGPVAAYTKAIAGAGPG